MAGALGVVLVARGPGEGALRAAAAERSSVFALALAEFDHDDLDAEREEILALATGTFRDEYESTFASPEVRAGIEDTEASATAEVVAGPFIAAVDEDEATTVTVVEQTVEASNVDGPYTRRLRLEIRLLHGSDGWLVNDVSLDPR